MSVPTSRSKFPSPRNNGFVRVGRLNLDDWAIRGLALAAVHVVVRSAMGDLVTRAPMHDGVFRLLAIAIVVLAALIWSAFDGARDGRQTPNPKHNADLTILWLKAAVIGSIIAGAASWAVGQATTIGVGRNSLFFELTSGAAFTMVLIFAPAVAGVTVGRHLGRRNQKRKNASQPTTDEDDEELEYLDDEVIDHSYDGPNRHIVQKLPKHR